MNYKIIALILCIIGILSLTACSKNTPTENAKPHTKYVDIYDVVKEAFLTDNGYTEELSKHMTQEVFKHTNYKMYRVNAPEFTKPLHIDINLTEVSQTKDKNTDELVYVDMIYSLKITDANGKTVGAASDIRVQFTVQTTGDKWYIIERSNKA